MLLFEPVVLGCGGTVLLIGLRIQKKSIPMALATAALCLAVAAFLSTVGGRSTLGGKFLIPLMGVRLLLSAMLGISAALLVLGKNSLAYKRVLIGCLMLLAGSILASVAFLDLARPIRDWLMSLGAFGASAISLAFFVVFVILVSAGTHQMVRPFELALDSKKPKQDPAS